MTFCSSLKIFDDRMPTLNCFIKNVIECFENFLSSQNFSSPSPHKTFFLTSLRVCWALKYSFNKKINSRQKFYRSKWATDDLSFVFKFNRPRASTTSFIATITFDSALSTSNISVSRLLIYILQKLLLCLPLSLSLSL